MSKERLSKMQKCILLLLYSRGMSYKYTLYFDYLRDYLKLYLNKKEWTISPELEQEKTSRSFSPALSRSLSNLLQKGLIERTGFGKFEKTHQLKLTSMSIGICLKLTTQGVNFKKDFRAKKIKITEYGLPGVYRELWIEEDKLAKELENIRKHMLKWD